MADINKFSIAVLPFCEVDAPSVAFLAGIHSAAAALGMRAIFRMHSAYMSESPAMWRQRYQGMITDDPGLFSTEETAHIRRLAATVPCVSLYRPIARTTRMYVVTHDSDKALAMLLDHLAAEGCRSIGYFNLTNGWWGTERYRSLLSGLPARRLVSRPEWAPGCMQMRRGQVTAASELNNEIASGDTAEKYFARIMLSGGRPDAVICSNDPEACLFMELAGKHRIRVPQDVAVTGFDNAADSFSPKYDLSRCEMLTSVDKNLEGSGRAAVRVLGDIFSGAVPPAMTVIEPVLMVRASSSRKAARGTRTADATRQQIMIYLQKYYAHPSAMNDIAANFGMARGYFLRRFRTLFGKTLSAWMSEFRITKAENLLRSTSRSATRIAVETGFTVYKNFSRAFTAAYGVSPRVFRANIRRTGRG